MPTLEPTADPVGVAARVSLANVLGVITGFTSAWRSAGRSVLELTPDLMWRCVGHMLDPAAKDAFYQFAPTGIEAAGRTYQGPLLAGGPDPGAAGAVPPQSPFST